MFNLQSDLNPNTPNYTYSSRSGSMEVQLEDATLGPRLGIEKSIYKDDKLRRGEMRGRLIVIYSGLLFYPFYKFNHLPIPWHNQTTRLYTTSDLPKSSNPSITVFRQNYCLDSTPSTWNTTTNTMRVVSIPMRSQSRSFERIPQSM